FSYTSPRASQAPLFPYTTLFRSDKEGQVPAGEERGPGLGEGPVVCVSEIAGLQAAAAGFARMRDASPHRPPPEVDMGVELLMDLDRKRTRLNSSHEWISYAVFCL